jgi:hypothetical protein
MPFLWAARCGISPIVFFLPTKASISQPAGKGEADMNRTNRSVLISVAAVLIMTWGGFASADPPRKVALDYSPTSKTLTVVAIHPTGNPEKHFIYRVVVSKTSKASGKKTTEVLEKRELEKQVAKRFQVAVFGIKDLAPDDVLSAKATCNKFGSKTGTVKNTKQGLKDASDAMAKLKEVKENEGLDKAVSAAYLDMKEKAKEATKKKAGAIAADEAKESASDTSEPDETTAPAPKPEK